MYADGSMTRKSVLPKTESRPGQLGKIFRTSLIVLYVAWGKRIFRHSDSVSRQLDCRGAVHSPQGC